MRRVQLRPRGLLAATVPRDDPQAYALLRDRVERAPRRAGESFDLVPRFGFGLVLQF